jgi:hypothetical protein
MIPLVEKLAQETGVVVERLEVWHDEKNADLMRSFRPLISAKCGGQLRVPTFLDPGSSEVLCGEVSYETLKAWALG